MRSYDYSHFEVTLGATIEEGDDHISCTDELRKTAQRHADHAVTQYKIAKANAERIMSEKRDRRWACEEIERIRARAETDRSPQDQAQLKAFDDTAWEARRRYNYEDDWRDDEAEDES